MFASAIIFQMSKWVGGSKVCAQSYRACVCMANYLLLEIKRFLQVHLGGICVSMRDCLSTEIFLDGILTVSSARQF